MVELFGKVQFELPHAQGVPEYLKYMLQLLVVVIVENIYPELKKIENELKEIKMMLKVQEKKPVKLGGALEGANVTEKDIKNAKKSLLKPRD